MKFAATKMLKACKKGSLEWPLFPILKLPTVVLFEVIEYLNAKEKGILSRVNKQFRDLMKSPNLWKDTTFMISPRKIDHCKYVVNLLHPRKAQSIIFASTCSRAIQRTILRGLPSIRSLTVDNPNPSTLKHIVNHAKHITKLHLGMVSMEKTPNLALCFKELEFLVEVSLDRNVFKFDFDITEEIKAALCCHGNLRSLQLHSFFNVDFRWLCDIIQKNPKLESLGLFFIRNITMVGPYRKSLFNDGFKIFKQTSTLKELNLCGSLRSNSIITQTIEWLDEYSALVYLNLSFSMDERVLRLAIYSLYKLPNLQKLDLTKCPVKDDMFLNNHLKLTSLELKSCFAITGKAIERLSSVMGSTLKYLGLSHCPCLKDMDLMDLTTLFPSLQTIDLSCCSGVSDVVFFQGFHSKNLRKIIVKGCPNVSEEVIQVVRQNSSNQIIIIR